ncbi:MAG: hypothetical protein LBR19_01960 [Bifidobacteriaceae bacterium]|nr:hypothetical protein [Bifidobacteriaceae bacterium]
MATKKKVSRVESKIVRPEGSTVKVGRTESTSTTEFIASPEMKGKARTLRLVAVVLWVLAIGAEAFAIFDVLKRDPVSLALLIGVIALDLVLAVAGSFLWKRSNKLDPASRQDKVRFFVQNQLGAIIAIIAFVPLVILTLTNKNLDGKQKGIAGAVAGVALVIAVALGIDWNPTSTEDLSEQVKVASIEESCQAAAQALGGEDAAEVTRINDMCVADSNTAVQVNGTNLVYWTKSGTVYHYFDDCPHINSVRTDELFSGTVATALYNDNNKNLERVDKDCAARAAAGETSDGTGSAGESETEVADGADASDDADAGDDADADGGDGGDGAADSDEAGE